MRLSYASNTISEAGHERECFLKTLSTNFRIKRKPSELGEPSRIWACEKNMLSHLDLSLWDFPSIRGIWEVFENCVFRVVVISSYWLKWNISSISSFEISRPTHINPPSQIYFLHSFLVWVVSFCLFFHRSALPPSNGVWSNQVKNRARLSRR